MLIKSKIWYRKGLWVAMIWSIWDHRNKIIFKQEKVDVEEVFHMAQLKTWIWMKSKLHAFNFVYFD